MVRFRVDAAPACRGSPVDVPRREEAIETALANKLADRAAKRELEAARAAKEIEEFSNEFLNAARKCFDLIDVDCSGTLTKVEIVEAVQTNETVVSFLRTCGEPNLQFLLQPKRLERALKVLDTSNDGEVDVDECAARRLTSRPIDATAASSPRTPGSLFDVRAGEEAINRGLAKRLQQMSEERARAARAAAAEDEEFSAEFLSMARQVFQMIDKDNSGTLVKAEMSARSVRPSTRARRGSHAIDATRCLPRDPPAASRP